MPTPSGDWHSAANGSPDQFQALWLDAVTRSRSLVAESLADGAKGVLAKRTDSDGQAPSSRWIPFHLAGSAHGTTATTHWVTRVSRATRR